MSDGTQVIHRVLNGLSIQNSSAKHLILKKVLWKTESAIVAMKCVMIMERRTDG